MSPSTVSVSSLIGSLLLAGLPAAQKQPVRIDHDAPMSRAGAVRIASSGEKVFAAWVDGRAYPGMNDIYFNRSLDGGATWWPTGVRIDLGTVPGGKPSFQPEIAANDSAVYVVWPDQRGTQQKNNLYFNRSLDAGTTWLGTAVRVDPGTPVGTVHASDARIAATSSAVYVLWRSTGTGILLNRSLDGGATWFSGGVRVDHGASTQAEFAVSGDSVFVVWRDARDGDSPTVYDPLEQDIYFNRSLDRGATWLPADVRLNTDLPPGTGFAEEPAISVQGDSLFVGWFQRGDEYQARFNRSLDGGATWLPADIPLSLPRSTPPHQIEIAASGPSVFVAWADRFYWTGGKTRFNRSLDGGASWLSSELELASDAGRPKIAALDASTVYVTWLDLRDGGPDDNGDIYVNRSLDGGTTWLAEDVRLSTQNPAGTVDSFWPELAISGSSAFVAWYAPHLSGDGIFFNLAHGYQRSGQGTGGTGGIVPRLRGSGAPAIGGEIRVDLVDGRGGALGALTASLEPASIPLSLGTRLVGNALFQAQLRLDGARGAAGAGSARRSFRIPDDPNLLGLRLVFQGSVSDPAAAGSVALTGALEAWIL